MRRALAIAGVLVLLGSIAVYLILREPERESRSPVTEVEPARLQREVIQKGTTPPPPPASVESKETEKPGRTPKWVDVKGFPTLVAMVGADLAERIANDSRLAWEDLPVIGRAVRKMDRLIVEDGSQVDEATGAALNENNAALQRAYYRAVRGVVGEHGDPESAARMKKLVQEQVCLKEEMRDATPEELAEALGALKVEILTGDDRVGTR